MADKVWVLLEYSVFECFYMRPRGTLDQARRLTFGLKYVINNVPLEPLLLKATIRIHAVNVSADALIH